MPEKQSLMAVHYHLLRYNLLNASLKFSSSCHGRQKYAFKKNAQFAEGLAESHVSSLSHMSCMQQHIRDGQSTEQDGFSSFDKESSTSQMCSIKISFESE